MSVCLKNYKMISDNFVLLPRKALWDSLDDNHQIFVVVWTFKRIVLKVKKPVKIFCLSPLHGPGNTNKKYISVLSYELLIFLIFFFDSYVWKKDNKRKVCKRKTVNRSIYPKKKEEIVKDQISFDVICDANPFFRGGGWHMLGKLDCTLVQGKKHWIKNKSMPQGAYKELFQLFQHKVHSL